MKILNRTYRDITGNEPSFQKTTITDLPETWELLENSLMHVVVKVGENDNYESMRISTDTFKQKIYEAVQNTFKTVYWDTHEFDYEEGIQHEVHDVVERPDTRPSGTSFKDLLKYLQEKDESKSETDDTVYAPEEVDMDDPNGFVDHLYYDFDLLKRYMVLKHGELESDMAKVNNKMLHVECHFAPYMSWKTTTLDNNNEVVVSDKSVNHGQTENDTYCQMKIESGNRISNEWVCPASGNLVVYGWLDSSACLNNKVIPSAFCALEGYINNSWEIVSVASVLPAKSITYVGFNVLVKENLKIRVRTGFDVGAKSGQYSNDQDGFDSLSNSTPNGFKCMIYYGKEDEQ